MPASQVEQVDRVLTPTAVAFVEELTRRFRPRIEELLECRRSVQQRYDNGERPDFLAETADIRNREWTVAPIPADLHDRRVEIASGPTSSPTPRSWSNAAGHAHRRRPAPQHPGRHPVSRSVAGRPGRGADRQPDGGCGDRRDLTDADLAVAQAPRCARGRQHGDP